MSKACLIYDGECPFCSRYVRLIRLRQTVGEVVLIDARRGGPEVEEMARLGYNLNEGMVFKLNDRIYHGADCIHRLALLSTPVDGFNRLNARLFARPAVAKVIYPLLRAGRNLSLRLLGRPPITP